MTASVADLQTLRRVPRQQRSHDRLDAILTAAAELLASVGPAGTTITAVADRAGLATSSVYDYVEGDRELIGAVAEIGLERIHHELVDVIGEPEEMTDLLESMSIGLRLFLDRYQHDTGLKEALAFIDADPELADINLRDTRRNAAMLTSAIRRVRPDADFGAVMLLLTHLTGSLAGLAARVSGAEAERLVHEYERLLVLVVTGPRAA